MERISPEFMPDDHFAPLIAESTIQQLQSRQLAANIVALQMEAQVQPESARTLGAMALGSVEVNLNGLATGFEHDLQELFGARPASPVVGHYALAA